LIIVSENGKLHQFSLFCLKREQKALDLEKILKPMKKDT